MYRTGISSPFYEAHLKSRNFKYIVHKYKKEVLTKYNKDMDTKIELYDDLTKVNLDCLRFLKSDANAHLVEKAYNAYNYQFHQIKSISNPLIYVMYFLIQIIDKN